MDTGGNFSNGIPSAGAFGGNVEIKWEHGAIEKAGKDIGEQAPNMGRIAQETGGIRVEPPAFGVIGIGLNYAHDQTKDGAVSALNTAKSVLADYESALESLEKNYRKADKDSDGVIKTGGDGPGGGIDPAAFEMPGGGGLPDGGLPDGGLPGGGLPDGGLPGGGLPDGGLPSSKLPGADVPSPEMPDTKVPSPEMPGADMPSPETPGADMPSTDMPQANVPSIEDQLNREVPQLDPNGTDLAGYNPSVPNPSLPNSSVPNPSTSLGPGAGPGMGTAPPSGGAAPGVQPGAAGARGGGMNGMGGMPFMPMMPGTGGGQQDRDREKPDYVRGDEADWLDDIDIAPQVIGEDE
ncbi:hypothetical protein FE391_39965 [Nonomuraea sp. KC401]|uniref:hypothetical protein n=1 Tax=unclassified Nonomuraea TaxID=2593643 RepID=UPI0010FCEE4C|nr:MULTISPECIES: hypothetical protein [unclassified Nonomuraea]NBE99234.1 hypothetical protein [Nonomuraea sp. K271]TLF55991.1 hypothetical protein FE391_39965 [Nonomuraea sp. KC401]